MRHGLTAALCLLACSQAAAEPVFRSIGKPVADQTTSRIATVGDRLFEYVSQMYFDGKTWTPMTDDESVALDNGFVINAVAAAGKTFRFVLNGKRCPGISVFSEDGYYGTYSGEDANAWSASYTDGRKVVLNVGYQVRIGDLGTPSPLDSCRPLGLKPVGPKGDWVHAYIAIPGGLLYGGRTSDNARCAALRILEWDTGSVQTLELPNCANGLVTEYYAYAEWNGEILIGNFPRGTLYAFDPEQRTVRETDIAHPRPDDLFDFRGRPYRESQALAVHDGKLYVGMYPWAEIFVFESSGQVSVTRLIPEPTTKGAELMPYATVMSQAALKSLDNAYRGVSEIPHEIEQRLRSEALTYHNWSQRASSFAVLGDRLCVSTGNLSGYAYDKERHPIPEEVARQYGEVHCVDTP